MTFPNQSFQIGGHTVFVRLYIHAEIAQHRFNYSALSTQGFDYWMNDIHFATEHCEIRVTPNRPALRRTGHEKFWKIYTHVGKVSQHPSLI